MPKYIIKEGILDKFLQKVFTDLATQKADKVFKAVKQDPELVKLLKKAEDQKKRIIKHIEDLAKTDPEAAEKYRKKLGTRL